MKNIFLFFVLCLLAEFIVAQNVGIGVSEPTQKLEVNGAVKVGTTASNQPGTIRFNGIKFEGGDGANWKSLEGTASGIVASATYNNPDLLNAGYTLYGEVPGISSYFTSAGFLSGLIWWPTYTRGIVSNVTAPSSGVAVWTGGLMYVASFTNLYSYDPVTDIWNVVSNQGFPGNQSKAIWTGTEIIFWNGDSGNGIKYNPSTNSWMNLPSVNAPSSRAFYTMIWDGTRLIIWGGINLGTDLNSGAIYNNSTNTWTTMSIVASPSARFKHTAVWANSAGRMIVWGGSNVSSVFNNSGAIFNPTTNTWTGVVNLTGAPSTRDSHTAVWTGTEMIILGGANLSQIHNTGGKYNPSTNTWTPTSTAGIPSLYNHVSIWTGSVMIVTGGESVFGGITLDNAFSYNPISNVFTNMGGFGDGKREHYSFPTNNMIVVWGGLKRTLSFPLTTSNTGYRYFLTDIVSSATTVLNNATVYLYQKN